MSVEFFDPSVTIGRIAGTERGGGLQYLSVSSAPVIMHHGIPYLLQEASKI